MLLHLPAEPTHPAVPPWSFSNASFWCCAWSCCPFSHLAIAAGMVFLCGKNIFCFVFYVLCPAEQHGAGTVELWVLRKLWCIDCDNRPLHFVWVPTIHTQISWLFLTSVIPNNYPLALNCLGPLTDLFWIISWTENQCPFYKNWLSNLWLTDLVICTLK